MCYSEFIEKSPLMQKIHKTLGFYAVMVLQRWRDLVWPIVTPVFDRPIFIVGCSRSGTTAVYNVLGMAPEVASLHKESHGFWNDLHPPSEKDWDSHMLTAKDINDNDREEVSRFYFRHLGRGRFVDKANQNCFRIPYLHALFPDAYFVYVKRDGRDNINSLIHGWGRPNEYGIRYPNLPADVRIGNGKYQQWCFFLFPGWRTFLKSSVEDICARQWIEANQAILSSKRTMPKSQWIEIHYENILTSAVETFREAFKKLDLSFGQDVKSHCETLVANPYNAFSRPRLNKWKEENKERVNCIIPIIAETMVQMGYKI